MVLGYCSQNKIYTVSKQKVLKGCVIVLTIVLLRVLLHRTNKISQEKRN